MAFEPANYDSCFHTFLKWFVLFNFKVSTNDCSRLYLWFCVEAEFKLGLHRIDPTKRNQTVNQICCHSAVHCQSSFSVSKYLREKVIQSILHSHTFRAFNQHFHFSISYGVEHGNKQRNRSTIFHSAVPNPNAKKKEKHKRKPYILKFTNWKLTKLTLIEETEENWSMADEWNEWNDCRYHRYIIQLVPLYRVFNTFNNAQFQLERLFIHWKISPRKETKVKRIKWLTIKKKWS